MSLNTAGPSLSLKPDGPLTGAQLVVVSVDRCEASTVRSGVQTADVSCSNNETELKEGAGDECLNNRSHPNHYERRANKNTL